MKNISSKVQFDEVIQSSALTVALFTADWCGDCTYIKPFMPEVQQKFAHQLTLVQVVVDQLPLLSEEHRVLGIPSFIAYTKGQEIVRFVSRVRKTRLEIEQFLHRAVSVYGESYDG